MSQTVKHQKAICISFKKNNDFFWINLNTLTIIICIPLVYISYMQNLIPVWQALIYEVFFKGIILSKKHLYKIKLQKNVALFY